MSSHRLRSTLYHSVPKPAARPAPLWQTAASLDPAARRRGESTPSAPSPSRRRGAEPAEDFSTRQAAILHARDAEDWRRNVLVAIVVCVGVFVAAIALWQSREPRVVFIPVPSQAASAPVAASARPVPPVIVADAPTVYQAPAAVYGTVNENPTNLAPRATAAPAVPLTWTPPASSMPTPVDYAARDRQIADLKRQMDTLDETVRRVRADPHWYGLVKGSTDTSRQQASDGYLKELDRQRDDLRRRKWALEGR